MSRDGTILRSCVSGLAALTCYEGISQQLAESAPDAMAALVSICSGETKDGQQDFGPAMLRNAAGAVANLALHPPARAQLLAADVVPALLLLMRRSGVGEYIFTGAHHSAEEGRAMAAGGSARAESTTRSGPGQDSADSKLVGADGIAGNAAWALHLSLRRTCQGR